MAKPSKTRASQQKYVSPTQGVLPCFELPFSGSLSPDNRWVVLAGQIPWDVLVNIYQKQMHNDKTGAGGINPRVALGCLIIKHICDLSDRETIEQVRENVYMQYFIGYSGFSDKAPFDASLFVELRKRLDMEQINAINERIIHFVRDKLAASPPVESVNKELRSNHMDANEPVKEPSFPPQPVDQAKIPHEVGTTTQKNSVATQPAELLKEEVNKPAHLGKMIIDATVCPQDIAYPTDLNLLNDAREKAEELIDVLYQKELHLKKPRTYRKKARKFYLAEAQKKNSSARAIRKANGKQLAFLKRDIAIIHRLLDQYTGMPLNRIQFNYEY